MNEPIIPLESLLDQYKDILLAPVNALAFTIRTTNCLATENIKYVGDLVQRTERELFQIPNLGRKSLDEIKEILASYNLSLGTEIAAWPPHEIGIPQVNEEVRQTVMHSLNYALRVAADKAHANCVGNDPDKARVFVNIVADILSLLGEKKL
jgi:hypothetical protein